ncbi:MAG: toxin [Helicobacteraceae bacterium]
MKKLAIFMALLGLCFAAESEVTDSFQIRNLSTGIPINIERGKQQFDYQNWFLNDLGLDKRVKAKDRFANKFLFGYVQMRVVAEPTKCLAILPSGFLGLKNCKQDYESGEFETIFQLMPTTTGAVQIRSLVLKTDECLGIFTNPSVSILDSVGLVGCVMDDFFTVETARLFVFTPSLSGASVVK